MKKIELTDEEREVIINKGTEAPFSGKLLHNKDKGDYNCKQCGNLLFKSDVKFDSGTGWPSFTDAVPDSIKFNDDNSLGMHRVEVVCSNCDGHLGHVFDDGPEGRKRYCINSICLDFEGK